MKATYIISAKRTAIGGFQGSLQSLTAPQLGAFAIKAAYDSVNLNPHIIEEVYFGNVLSANLGQLPARQVAILAGLHVKADCTTINKVCSSGLKSVSLGAQQIQLGLSNIVMAGGTESMSNTPYYLPLRKHNKLGDEKVIDGILRDGLVDAYNKQHMGIAAELCAKEFKISRTKQDEYALQSYEKASQATAQGKFKEEITPIRTEEKNGEFVFDKDEDIGKIIPEKVPYLKSVFQEDGTVTAANASNLNDGAAAVLLASEEALNKYSIKPLAKIIAFADAAQAPERFTTSPAVAINRVLVIAGLQIKDIDFFEINEAYAVVALANQKLLNLPSNKLNVYVGAVAMGHPLGASGARIICTLLSVLRQEKGKYGIAAICNGGGGASAMLIENLQL
jgi:acetyl-CoA C-acetyltransferase